MRRLLVGATALLLLATVVAGSTWGLTASAATPALYLVGYSPENAEEAKLAIQAAGGSVRRASAELGFAVVETSQPDLFVQAAKSSPWVQYVEGDDRIALSGAQWNGAQWNGAQWNGAQWNGAQWNGAQWNSMREQGAQWNGAQWNAHQWTIKHSPSKWSFDTGSTDPGLVWQWGAWAMKTPEAWTTSRGTGSATICVIDSGVAWDHPDLAPNMWTGPLGERGYNAINPSQSAYDDGGHGTHVAGVAAATVGNAFGIAGVSNAKIMPVKVLDANGYGTEDNLAFGLVWCANQGADVALMALSADAPGPTLDRALAYAAQRDVLMVASAGNGGACSDCVAFPGSDPRVVAVAAIDGNLKPAAFSSAGPQVEIAAPGVAILGPLPGGAFAFGSGTSQAAAYAAGLAALVRDADPTLTADEARAILGSTALDLGAAGADVSTGKGLIQAPAALAAARAP